MTIVIGCDHGGLEHKNAIKEHLEERGFTVTDCGIYEQKSVNYPEIAEKVALEIVNKKAELGILVCGTGIGISIAANKVKGVRCGLCTSVEMAHLTKQHNNANILALGGRTTAPELAMAIVDEWLDTEFEGGRHQRRVDMLDAL